MDICAKYHIYIYAIECEGHYFKNKVKNVKNSKKSSVKYPNFILNILTNFISVCRCSAFSRIHLLYHYLQVPWDETGGMLSDSKYHHILAQKMKKIDKKTIKMDRTSEKC